MPKGYDAKPSGREGTTEQLMKRYAELSAANAATDVARRDSAAVIRARADEMFQIHEELKARRHWKR